MKKINLGSFEGDTYKKYIDYNRAVLWKTRQISLSKAMCDKFAENGIKTIVLIDEKKEKKYTIPVETFDKIKEDKTMHQEPQYYFSIAYLKEEKLSKKGGEE